MRGLYSLIERYDQEPEHKKVKSTQAKTFVQNCVAFKKLVVLLNPQQ